MMKFCLTIAVLILAASVLVQAQTSIFSSQGRLVDTGIPASGTHQMKLALYDAGTGGTQISSTVENTAVAVSNGVFMVQLDYGTHGSPGAESYLEIRVRQEK